MKMKSIIIHSVAIALLLASIGFNAKAQENRTSIWGNRGGHYVGDKEMKTEEEVLLESLITEEEAEQISKLFHTEEYEFPMDIRDNWHLGLHLGAMHSWGSYDNEAGWLKRTNFAAALSFGKYLTPVNDLRFQLFYGRGTGVRGADEKYDTRFYPYNLAHEKALADFHTYNWHTAGISAQWLPNFTNLFLGYNPERRFTFSGLVGIGLEHTWSYNEKELSIVSVWAEKAKSAAPRNLVDLEFGVVAEFKLNNRLFLNLDVIDRFLDDTFDGLVSDQKWDGHLDVLLGLTYFIPGKPRKAEPEGDFFLHRPIIDIPQPGDSIIDVDKDVIYTLISFDENTVEVPRLQQNNVYQTAQAYQSAPKSNIFITNSNKLDDNTFHKRAWAISKLLHQRWQIPYEHIWVDADEDHIQKLQMPNVKTYIIFIINEE